MCTENDITVKEFSYSVKESKFYATIIRRVTPETETGITWEVLSQVNSERCAVDGYDRYSVAEMAFKNFVLQALNTDTTFYTYNAER